MLLRLATVVLCLSAVSSGLPAAIKVGVRSQFYQTAADWLPSLVKQMLNPSSR